MNINGMYYNQVTQMWEKDGDFDDDINELDNIDLGDEKVKSKHKKKEKVDLTPFQLTKQQIQFIKQSERQHRV